MIFIIENGKRLLILSLVTTSELFGTEWVPSELLISPIEYVYLVFKLYLRLRFLNIIR